MIALIAVVGVIAAAGWLVWAVQLGRFVRSAGQLDPAPGALPAVTIVVPARDEEHNLPPLLASLAALAPAPAQLVVVDDHSSDATATVAARAGAEVVTPPPLPAGWVGKPWACRRGAEAARGELLLFTDADTVHAPGSLGRAVARLVARDAALVSIVPTHVAVAWWERLQAVFHLLLVIATAGGRDFAIGQYLLVRRRAYDAIGGHEGVRARIAEDLGMMRAIRAAGGGYQLVLAPGALRVRMYPEGLGSFLRGWRRNFREGIGAAGLRGVLAVVLVCGWLGGLPLLLALAAVTGQAALAAVVAVAWALSLVDIARRQRLVAEVPAWTAALAPLAVLAFTRCALAATFDHLRGAPVLWRGRRIAAPRWR